MTFVSSEAVFTGGKRRCVEERVGHTGDWTRGLPLAKRTRYHCAMRPAKSINNNHNKKHHFIIAYAPINKHDNIVHV